MRILYIDIDSLRPDHLGCYGYGRDTSPNIDRLAREGVVFDNVHASDAPCMPSRTSLFSGRFGIHHGCVSHTGTRAEPFPEGTARRGLRSQWGRTNWMRHLRDAGMHTATFSSFGERHSAWHWYAGFAETHDTGHFGHDIANQITPAVGEWPAARPVVGQRAQGRIRLVTQRRSARPHFPARRLSHAPRPAQRQRNRLLAEAHILRQIFQGDAPAHAPPLKDLLLK